MCRPGSTTSTRRSPESGRRSNASTDLASSSSTRPWRRCGSRYLHSAMQLEGKVAVVTGASSGIGHATARALAAAGMTVVAVARRGALLEALAASEARVRPFPADVTSDEDVAGLASWVAGELGACHVLVN